MKKITLALLLVAGMIYVTLPVSVRAQETADTNAAPMAGEEEQTDIVAGKVTAVDAAGNTLSVSDEAGKPYTVTATKEETSIWKGDDTINLSDVKVGDSVELEYYKNKDGKSVAIWVDVLTKESVPPAEATPAQPAVAVPVPAPAEAPAAAPAPSAAPDMNSQQQPPAPAQQ